MPLDLTISGAFDDYHHFDNPHTVNVVSRRKGGDQTDTGIKAFRQSLAIARSIFSGIDLKGHEVIWMVPVPELTNVTEITRDDRIIDNSDTWIVKTSQLVKWSSQWLCVTEKGR